eukprot:scaffold576_cov260-Pinguiococcus_pyrenoidosus.AAC.113
MADIHKVRGGGLRTPGTRLASLSSQSTVVLLLASLKPSGGEVFTQRSVEGWRAGQRRNETCLRRVARWCSSLCPAGAAQLFSLSRRQRSYPSSPAARSRSWICSNFVLFTVPSPSSPPTILLECDESSSPNVSLSPMANVVESPFLQLALRTCTEASPLSLLGVALYFFSLDRKAA